MGKIKSEKLITLRSRILRSKKQMEQEKLKVWTPCRDFFEGRHWPSTRIKLRTINLILATVRTILASQYFRNPKFTLKPRKPEFEGPIRALHEAILQYWIDKALLKPIARSCVQATFTDLGIITWGCDTKFREGTTTEDSFYFRRIEPEHFYPDHSLNEQLFEKLPGYAFSELLRTSEVSRRWGINEKKLEATESIFDMNEERRNAEFGLICPEVKDDIRRIKIYRYFDREEGKTYIFTKEGSYDDFLDVSDLSEACAVLKYCERSSGFYPMPEIEPWIDPQKIIEIAASMAVEHMKRAARKVEVQEGALDVAEEEKLENPETGVIVHVKKRGLIGPIEQGQTDSSIFNVGALFGQYFDQIAGVNVSRRGGGSQKLTATAEAIIDRYGMDRSSDRLGLLSDFMIKIGKGFLDMLQANLTLPGVIQITNEQNALQWISYIPTIDIVGDYECKVQIGDTAPKDDQLERAQWIDCLGVLQTNPMILQSSLLIEETLARFNIDNPRLRDEIVAIGQLMVQQQITTQVGNMMSATPSKSGPMAGANLRI